MTTGSCCTRSSVAGAVIIRALERLVHDCVSRSWFLPGVVAILTVIGGMGYSLSAVDRVVQSGHTFVFWYIPSDVWGTFRAAQEVTWGNLAGVYTAGTGLVSFPGLPLLLAPVAWMADELHLSASLPLTLMHPTAWLLLGPTTMAAGSSVLFAADTLARRLGVAGWKRLLHCALQGLILMNIDAFWGHAEDAVAVALVLWGLIAAHDDRWQAAGWSLGAAIAFQPLVLLAVPMFIAMATPRLWIILGLRMSAPTVGLLTLPLIRFPTATVASIMKQPNFPTVDHITPWTSLAPVIKGYGHVWVVSAGPGRVAALIATVALAVIIRQPRHSLPFAAFMLATAFSLRVATESVMVSYYVWPAVAVALVVASTSSRRLVAGGIIALATIGYSNFHGPWLRWWLLTTGGMVAVVALAWRSGTVASDQDGHTAVAGTEGSQAATNSLHPGRAVADDPSGSEEDGHRHPAVVAVTRGSDG